MREVRVDAFTNNMIIIVKDRDKRPIDTKICQKDIESKNMYEEKCPFCKGNENYTTESTFEVIEEDNWVAKSVYNKYPILDENSLEIYGIHEVIIDTYRHNGSFYDMSEKEFYNMFKVYQNRYKKLIENNKVK